MLTPVEARSSVDSVSVIAFDAVHTRSDMALNLDPKIETLSVCR